MSWLARLEVDAQTINSEGISTDIYTWHKKLWECCPNLPEAERDFLTRIDQLEGAYRLWVLAKSKPVRPAWCPPDGFVVKEISPSFLTHRFYAFDLRANPVKTLVQRGPDGETLFRPNGKRKHGKRVPIVKLEELQSWLIQKGKVRSVVCRKGEAKIEVAGGFRIVEDKPLEISPMIESHFSKKDKKNNREYAAYHGGVQFRGTLEVTDQERFIETYQAGVGSAKGFGFGLLLLAPINL